MDDGSNACVFLLAVQVFFFSGYGEKDDGEIDLMAGARSCTVKYVIYINIFFMSLPHLRVAMRRALLTFTISKHYLSPSRRKRSSLFLIDAAPDYPC